MTIPGDTMEGGENPGAKLMSSSELQELVKFAQIIPRKMMDALRSLAEKKEISIDLEVTSRLLATILHPEQFGLKFFHKQILMRKFSTKEAFKESEEMRKQWVYTYEIAKLRLFLKLKRRLPRNFKEHFTVIDVKATTKRILDEGDDPDESNE